MTVLYLSGVASSETWLRRFVHRWDWKAQPLNILVSFAYLDHWRKEASMCPAARLMLDSGAFTSHTRGDVIDHDALIAEATSGRWTEAIGLDVIGDWRASEANADREHALVPGRMIPTFHLGDPWELLAKYVARSGKVAIGGMVGAPLLLVLRFLEQVFARAWPHRLHSFGRIDEKILTRFPFESADSSNWLIGVVRFGGHAMRKGGRTTGVRVPGSRGNISMGVAGVLSWMDAMYQRERRLREFWSRELSSLNVKENAS